MATPSIALISALRETANRVEAGARYEWGHMARCNCGHLVQTVTCRSQVEISRLVTPHLREWTEHARDHCPHTGHPVESLFEALRQVGFEREDVIHLENLSDPKVLATLGTGVHLRRNDRDDLVRYLRAMAQQLEEQMPGAALAELASVRSAVIR